VPHLLAQGHYTAEELTEPRRSSTGQSYKIPLLMAARDLVGGDDDTSVADKTTEVLTELSVDELRKEVAAVLPQRSNDLSRGRRCSSWSGQRSMLRGIAQRHRGPGAWVIDLATAGACSCWAAEGSGKGRPVPECARVSQYQRHPLRLQGGVRRRRVVLFRRTACLAICVAACIHWQGAVCSAGEEALRPRPFSVSLLGQAQVARPRSGPLVGASLRLRGGRHKF